MLKCHSGQRCSTLTNTLFKLDKLCEKFASCRLAVAKINPRRAGTRSDVFSLQHKSWTLLAKNVQVFLGDENKCCYILSVVNSLIPNCAKDDVSALKPCVILASESRVKLFCKPAFSACRVPWCPDKSQLCVIWGIPVVFSRSSQASLITRVHKLDAAPVFTFLLKALNNFYLQ